MNQSTISAAIHRTLHPLVLAILCGVGCDRFANGPTAPDAEGRHGTITTDTARDDEDTIIGHTADGREPDVMPLTSTSQLADLLGKKVRLVGRPANNKYDGFGVRSDWMKRGRLLAMKGKDPWSPEATEGVIEVTGMLRRTPPYTIDESQRRELVQYHRGPGHYPGDFYLDDYLWVWLTPPAPVEAPQPW